MTLVVAHRGASRHAPENTLEAFRLAIEQGADAIELDVHLTSDGQVAVIHDDTLDRTTDRTGRVEAMTMDEIHAADAGHTFAREGDAGLPFRGKGLRVPSLPEVIEWLPDGIGLVVEIKARGAVQATIAALAGSRVREAGHATVLSFDEAALERAREIDPKLPTGYLLVPTQPFEPALVWVTERGHIGIHPWDGDLGADPTPHVAQAAVAGRRLGCYVVNDPARMQLLAAMGLWGFVTDVPDVAREALGPPAPSPVADESGDAE